MINILRKNQKGLWIVIALLCIPFVFYFTNSKVGPIGRNEFGRIYGQPITTAEGQRGARLLNLASELGMESFLQDMVAGAQSRDEAFTDFVWNRMILLHEAERLGLAPSQAAIVEVVKTLRPFRGEKGFDINKYNDFTRVALPAMGFGEAEIEELASNQLMLQRLQELIGSGVNIPESEAKENYERAYGKLNLVVARVRSEDAAKSVDVSDDVINSYYEAHQAELKSDEKRKVSFVAFGLDEEQKKLAGKERVELLQKLADSANDFNQALLEKGAQFEQVAAKFQRPIQSTGEFTMAAPDPLLKVGPTLTEAAFQLTPQEPNTDALQGGDSFYILHLAGIDEAKPLSLQDARPKIVEQIKAQKLGGLVAAQGAAAAQKIREALKAGTPLDAAMQQTGLPVEKVPPFALSERPAMQASPSEQPKPATPDLEVIKSVVADMNAGEVSDFIPTEDGGAVAVLEKRDAPDPAMYEVTKTFFNSRFMQSKRQVAFYEWMRERRREAGVQPAADPRAANEAG